MIQVCMYEVNVLRNMFCVQLLCCSEDGDVAITGISADFDSTGASSFCVNDVICEVKNDSVIMKGDADKYRNSDEPDSESSCSSDSDEMTWR